jgi:hypothetical protein
MVRFVVLAHTQSGWQCGSCRIDVVDTLPTLVSDCSGYGSHTSVKVLQKNKGFYPPNHERIVYYCGEDGEYVKFTTTLVARYGLRNYNTLYGGWKYKGLAGALRRANMLKKRYGCRYVRGEIVVNIRGYVMVTS